MSLQDLQTLDLPAVALDGVANYFTDFLIDNQADRVTFIEVYGWAENDDERLVLELSFRNDAEITEQMMIDFIARNTLESFIDWGAHLHNGWVSARSQSVSKAAKARKAVERHEAIRLAIEELLEAAV